MRRVLRRLEALGLAAPADLTPELVARYVASRDVAGANPNTIIGELGYLRAVCSIAVEEGLVDRTPFIRRRFRLRPAPLAGRTHLTRGEMARLLGELAEDSGSWRGHRLHAVAATVAYTGLRRSEALYLRLEDVELDRGLLFVSARRRLKTRAAAAPVPIPQALARILEGWIPRAGPVWLFPGLRGRGPWTGGAGGSRALDELRAAGERAGIRGLTFKSLRHSWATHAEGWGLSELQIQRVLRHTTPLTQRHYRHADLDGLRAIGARVCYRAAGDPIDPDSSAVPSPALLRGVALEWPGRGDRRRRVLPDAEAAHHDLHPLGDDVADVAVMVAGEGPEPGRDGCL